MNFSKTILLASACGSLFFAHPCHAVSLLDNYPPSNDSLSASVSTAPDDAFHAVSFTVPALSYQIDSVTLRLSSYNTTDVPQIGFYTDNGDKPGTLVGSLLSNPGSATTSTADFTFLPVGLLTLASNTKYWLQVQSAQGGFLWRGSNSDTPYSRTPSGEASFGSYKGSDGTSYAAISQLPVFAINATPSAVPEPSEYAMIAGAGLLGFVAWRRSRKLGLACT